MVGAQTPLSERSEKLAKTGKDGLPSPASVTGGPMKSEVTQHEAIEPI
jgi:hypothetical protein